MAAHGLGEVRLTEDVGDGLTSTATGNPVRRTVPSVTAPVEVWLGNWLACFDGRVFEVFSPYQEGSVRYHVRLMVDFRIDRSTLTANLQGNDNGRGRSPRTSGTTSRPSSPRSTRRAPRAGSEAFQKGNARTPPHVS